MVARRALQEVLRFMFLVFLADDILTPSQRVDLAWHEFILTTRPYHKFCEKHFGQYIHHSPGGTDEENRTQFQRTLQLYREHFDAPDDYFWGHNCLDLSDTACGACEKVETSFDSFLESIEKGFKQHMKVDQVLRDLKTQIIRSAVGSIKSKMEIRKRLMRPSSSHSEPLYYGYYGYDKYFFYSWLWSDMCHHQGIHCRDISIVNETGTEVLQVDENGVDMGAQDPSELGAASESGAFFSGSTAGESGDSSSSFFGAGGDSGGSSCGSSCGSSSGGGCGGCGR